MKKNSATLFARLGENEVNKLTHVVKETLAPDFQPVTAKIGFTAAQLWDIQRRKKSMVQRRFIF
jgi:hypothetical protein